MRVITERLYTILLLDPAQVRVLVDSTALLILYKVHLAHATLIWNRPIKVLLAEERESAGGINPIFCVSWTGPTIGDAVIPAIEVLRA